MCLKELLDELRERGVTATEAQIRWAIRTEKVSRPRLNGSLRFEFSPSNLAELVEHFSASEVPA